MVDINLKKLKLFAEYCGEIWCEWYDIFINEPKMEIHITADTSRWIIHLSDYDKFNRYILWHYNHDNRGNYHRQRSYVSIYNAIACAFAHDFDKKYQVDFNQEDFKRLREDFDRVYKREVIFK